VSTNSEREIVLKFDPDHPEENVRARFEGSTSSNATLATSTMNPNLFNTTFPTTKENAIITYVSFLANFYFLFK
jgi:hypothetical protein